MPFKLTAITPKQIPYGPADVEAIKKAMRDLVIEGQRFIAYYPPAPPSQHYVRTGTLKRSWSQAVVATGFKVEGIVGSNSRIAPYNSKVQGETQTAFFASRGWRDVETLKKKIEG